MSETDDGRRAPNSQTSDFAAVMAVQSEAYALRDLTFSLSLVIRQLSETEGVSRLPAVMAADTLAERLYTDQLRHLDTLDRLETGEGV